MILYHQPVISLLSLSSHKITDSFITESFVRLLKRLYAIDYKRAQMPVHTITS